MITEDYVSFEIAKLLNEKGFDEKCNKVIHQDTKNEYYFGNYTDDIKGRLLLVPTLQMTMKWLRETHNIFIEISVDEMLRDEGYQWALYYNNTKEIRPYSGWGNSYEEACEAAIKYCLENLI